MKLYDNHVHTHYAYCSDDDMFPETSISIAKQKGCGITITEHAGHLYTTHEIFCSQDYTENQELIYDEEHNRMDGYIEYISKFRDKDVKIGIEAEVFSNGELTLKEQHKDCWDIILGAVHFIPARFADDYSEGFLWMTEKLCSHKIDVLAHPFRIFTRQNMPVPKSLYKPTIELLKKAGVAAEINFHTYTPDIEFFRMCADSGVKISLGSDAHSLYEVCDLVPHVRMLKQICGEDYSGVLFQTGERNNK